MPGPSCFLHVLRALSVFAALLVTATSIDVTNPRGQHWFRTASPSGAGRRKPLQRALQVADEAKVADTKEKQPAIASVIGAVIAQAATDAAAKHNISINLTVAENSSNGTEVAGGAQAAANSSSRDARHDSNSTSIWKAQEPEKTEADYRSPDPNPDEKFFSSRALTDFRSKAPSKASDSADLVAAPRSKADPGVFKCLNADGNFSDSNQCATQADAADRCYDLNMRLCGHDELGALSDSCPVMYTSTSATIGFYVGNGKPECGGPIAKGILMHTLQTTQGEGRFDAACCHYAKPGRYQCVYNLTFDSVYRCSSQGQAERRCKGLGLRLCGEDELLDSFGQDCTRVWTGSNNESGFFIGNGECGDSPNKGKPVAALVSWRGPGMYDAACCDDKRGGYLALKMKREEINANRLADPGVFQCPNENGVFGSYQCKSQSEAISRCTSLRMRLCRSDELNATIGESCGPLMYTADDEVNGHFIGDGDCGGVTFKSALVNKSSSSIGKGLFDAACCLF